MKYILIVLCLFLAGANAKKQEEAKDFIQEVLQRLGEIDHKVQEIVKNLTNIDKDRIEDNLKKLDKLRDANYSCVMHELKGDFDKVFGNKGVIFTCLDKAETDIQNIGDNIKAAVEKVTAQGKTALEKYSKCVKDSELVNIMSCLNDLMAESGRIKDGIKKVVEKPDNLNIIGQYFKCCYESDAFKALGKQSTNVVEKCGTTGTHK